MTLVQAEETNYLKIPIPGENSNPFMDAFRQYTKVIEEAVFFRKLMSNFILSGGGVRSWDPGTQILSWTEDWKVPVYHWGRVINIVHGPDGINRALTLPNGSALMIELPISMNNNISVNFKVVSQLDQDKNNQWIAGWNNDGVVQLRDIGELS